MMIQILLTAASAFVIAKAFRSYRKRQVGFSTFFMWSLFWLLITGVIWQPELANRLADFLQVGRGVDAVMYLSLIFIFYLLFKIFARFERVDRELTDIIRELALIRKKTPDNN